MDKKEKRIAARADWNITQMPEKNSTFLLVREFSAGQIAALRRGNIPETTEDKWFRFMEGDTLYAHRSWTGVCVYRIDFSFADNRHKVTVNKDPAQVSVTSEDEDRQMLADLLERWSNPDDAPYGMWILETEGMLKRAGQISKNAEDYRMEGIALERQEKYEEAFLKYEEAAKMDDVPSMILIADMYLSGNFRPVDSSDFAELLHQGTPVFPWNLKNEKLPNYKSGLEWLIRAADLGDGGACEAAGNMLCSGMGCKADIEKGIAYLEKAAASGQESARKSICLYRPNGKALTDAAYEACLAEFTRLVDAGDDQAYELYATLKSGTQKQLARFGHVLIAAQNIQKNGYEVFKYASTPSGIPLLPVAPKRLPWAWVTFLRFNLEAWAEKYPLIAVSADILHIASLLVKLYRARIVGTAKYRSPSFGWLKEEKYAVLIRLGENAAISNEKLEEEMKAYEDGILLTKEDYQGESVAFIIEDGEKEYSFEIAGIKDDKVEVLWRYTIGGNNDVTRYFEPQLISMNME